MVQKYNGIKLLKCSLQWFFSSKERSWNCNSKCRHCFPPCETTGAFLVPQGIFQGSLSLWSWTLFANTIKYPPSSPTNHIHVWLCIFTELLHAHAFWTLTEAICVRLCRRHLHVAHGDHRPGDTKGHPQAAAGEVGAPTLWPASVPTMSAKKPKNKKTTRL